MNRILTLLASIQDKKELAAFLDVFLTDKEREMLAERLQIFDLLRRGHTQRQIALALGCGIATVTRGARAYRTHQAQVDRWLGGTPHKASR